MESRRGSFHADLDVPLPSLCFPDYCSGHDDVSVSSLGSRNTQVMELFPRSPLDLGEAGEPYKYKYHGFKAKLGRGEAFPLWRDQMTATAVKPRSFLSAKQFVDYVKAGFPSQKEQSLADLRRLDPFFYYWLEETDQLDLKCFEPQQVLQDDRAFVESWGKSQVVVNVKTLKVLNQAYPHLAIRFFFFRNNSEALFFAQIHLALITSGRQVTQPFLPWLRDQYLGH